MIAVDTNFLVYAQRADVPQHARALSLLIELTEGEAPWALPWPCVHEFFSSVTTSRWKSPTSPARALAVLKNITASPRVHVIGEGVEHLEILSDLVTKGRIHGAAIHDARIAAICIAHGINELWTADRDFSRFPLLKTYNPFEGSHDRRHH